MTPARKFLHTSLIIVAILSWTPSIFNAASTRGLEPFRTITYRARLTRFYGQHAPSKVQELPSILSKYQGQEDSLLKKLEHKYSTGVQELDLASLAGSLASTSQESVMAQVPPDARKRLRKQWETFERLPFHIQLTGVAAQAMALTLGLSLLGFAPKTRVPTFFFLFAALSLALLPPPALEDCNPAVVDEAMVDFWTDLDMQLKLFAVTGVAFSFAILRESGQRRAVFIGWVAAVLWLTNPGTGVETLEAGRDSDAPPGQLIQALASVAEAASGKSPGVRGASIYRSLPKGTVVVHDLGLMSILTWSKEKNHNWLSSVLSVGALGRWTGFVELIASSSRLAIKGYPIPAWSVPAALFLVWMAVLN